MLLSVADFLKFNAVSVLCSRQAHLLTVTEGRGPCVTSRRHCEQRRHLCGKGSPVHYTQGCIEPQPFTVVILHVPSAQGGGDAVIFLELPLNKFQLVVVTFLYQFTCAFQKP